MRKRHPLALPGTFLAQAGLLVTGCGAPAAPQPPTLNLPQPVRDLTASRQGNSVLLSFTLPEKTTDKLPVHGAMSAVLCRSLALGPCQPVQTMPLSPGEKLAIMSDALPPSLDNGELRLLTYQVTAMNRAAKAAAASNPAYTVAGTAPLPVMGFKALPERHGIVRRGQQQSEGAELPAAYLRVKRTRLSTSSKEEEQQTREPADRFLRVTETAHRAIAIDATARTGNDYSYAAQRILEITLDGHALTIAGPLSPGVDVRYRDIFPPEVPVGLVSAADTRTGAIDLSWTPDTDSGLAGYVVYRRDVDSSGAPQRLTPVGKPATVPAWHDRTVVPGERYAYSVSAIDASGNESPRSAEVQESLPKIELTRPR